MRTRSHKRAVAVAVLSGLALLPAALPVAAQQQQAGVAAAVRGRVELAERPGAVGRLVKSGEPIFLGNAIKSGPASGMQIMLLDETTFTIGADSEITIDEFVYDPRTSAGKVTASVAKGVFRFVTGKVAQQDPQNMQVRLPTGNIGIRGTIALGRVDTVQQNGQTLPRQQVILVGPGGDREGTNRRGGLSLTFPGQSQPLEIWRAGFGTESIGGNPWTTPAPFQTVLATLQTLLQNSQTGGPGTPLPPNPQANEIRDQMFTLGMESGTLANQTLTQGIIQMANTGAAEGNQSGIRSMTGIADGFSTYEQLRTINNGQFFWSQTNVPFTDLPFGGSPVYSLFLNIDFGKRSVGGGNSRIDITNTSSSGSVALPSQSFATLNGAAAFGYSGLPGYFDPQICDGACQTSLLARPVNSGGTVGKVLQHTVTLEAFGQVTAVGSGTTGPRQPGSAP